MAAVSQVLQAIMTGILVLAGFVVLFLMYFKSPPAPKCYPHPAHPGQRGKPVLLLWFWPENKRFDFEDCQTHFNIDSCHLTDDRSVYPRAKAVLIFHKAIQDDLSNLPTARRTKLQRWIWFSMDSPANTRRINGITGLFNLTMSYRKDSDIHVRWNLGIKNNTDRDFVLPKKERLLCWIVESADLQNKSREKYSYFRQLVKHIKVDIFDHSDESVKGENYFQTISSCKFYLSFEDSNHTDYITEEFNGPLAAGTVPVVLGPSRINYEDFAPGNSFIHVSDFPDAEKLAEFLQKLDGDNEAYMRYFDWRQFYSARRHLLEEKHKFALAICQACRHVALFKEFRVVPDIYKWFFV